MGKGRWAEEGEEDVHNKILFQDLKGHFLSHSLKTQEKHFVLKKH